LIMEKYDGRNNKDYMESEKARQELLEEDPSLKELFDHPLNANKITPELLARPEFAALQSLVYEGEPEEIAQNFLNHGKRVYEESCELSGEKAKIKILDSLNCFTEGIEQKCKDNAINFELNLGVAKCQMYLKNYKKIQEAVDAAIKYKQTAEVYYYGAISRFHVSKWQE